MTTEFKPFADETASLTLAGLTVENGKDRIALYGNLDIGRTPSDLEQVRKLAALLNGVAKAIEANPASGPAEVAEAPVVVKNPLA